MTITRRAFLTTMLAAPLLAPALADDDDALLDEIERASFRYFWEQAHPLSGQVKDRARASGRHDYLASSIAATGFGLTALCIADRRAWADVRSRVRLTLRFIEESLPHVHGFYYHFVDWRDGKRLWDCELSTIDTALLLCGVLACRAHFRDDPAVVASATKIYERVDWPWFLAGGTTFSMGWKPASGFLESRWSHYCELMMLYLLAIGSPTHPLPPASWHAWTRPKVKYDGLEYVSGAPPLFTHQYSHAWFDFRGKRDAYADWFENSRVATEAHRRFCLSLRAKYPDYSDDLWGITASDSSHGYVAWGGPPAEGPIDGTVVPCAAGGSIPFLPAACLRVLRTMRKRYGATAWGRYSFVDAFNPLSGWVNPDVLGIDLGITMLMAENQRTGFVWDTFMRNPEMPRAMQLAGFRVSSRDFRS